MSAIPSVLVQPFWDSEKGFATKCYFDAYGAVVREREASGDPTALPKGDTSVSGGKRGSPSNPADALLMFAEVANFLGKYVTKRQAALINFVFVDGVGVSTKYQYTYADDSASDWLPEGHEEPKVPVKSVATSHRMIYTYNLSKFESPELEEVSKLWKVSKRDLLIRELERVGKLFAKIAGL